MPGVLPFQSVALNFLWSVFALSLVSLHLEVAIVLGLKDLKVALNLVIGLKSLLVIEVSLAAKVFLSFSGCPVSETQVRHSDLLANKWVYGEPIL